MPVIVAMIIARSLEGAGGAGAGVGKEWACGVFSSREGVRAQ